MVSTPRVLIVDPSEETREVLKTALERRGVQTLAAGHIRPAIKLVKEHCPHVVVLDLEAGGGSPEEALTRFSAATEGAAPRLLILGSVRRPQIGGYSYFVAKPYHFGPLIRRIEELLTAVEVCARSA